MQFEPIGSRVSTLPHKNQGTRSVQSETSQMLKTESLRPLICVESDAWMSKLSLPINSTAAAELIKTMATRNTNWREPMSARGSGKIVSGATVGGSQLSVNSEVLDRKESKFEKNRHYSSQRIAARPTNSSATERPVSTTSLVSFQYHLDKDHHQFKSLESLDSTLQSEKQGARQSHHLVPGMRNHGDETNEVKFEKDVVSDKIKFARSLSRNLNMNKILNNEVNDDQTPLVSIMQQPFVSASQPDQNKADISKSRLNRFSFDASNFLLSAVQVQKLDSISPISSRSDISSDFNDASKSEKIEKNNAGVIYEIKKLQQRLKSANEKIGTLENEIATNVDISLSYQATIDNLTSKIERLNLIILEKETNEGCKRSSVKFSTLKSARNSDEMNNFRDFKYHASCQSIDNVVDEAEEVRNKGASKKKLKFSIKKAFSRKKSIVEKKYTKMNVESSSSKDENLEREVTELRLQSLAQQQQLQQLQDNILALNSEISYLKEENLSLKVNFLEQ